MQITHPFISEYLVSHCPPPDGVLSDLEAETRRLAPNLQSSHYESELLSLFTRMLGARKAIVLGVFTGYSTVCMARGMPEDGHILGCEVDGDWAAIAQRHIEKGGLADRIDLRVQPALELLAGLPEQPTFDLAHIGADKANFPVYYEELLGRLRPGGVIMLGDVLRSARLFDDDCRDDEALIMRELNDAVARDERVDSAILAVGDGVTMVRKR